MAPMQLLSGFDSEDYNYFRLVKAVGTVAREVLLQVVRWGLKKDPKVTLWSFLRKEKKWSNSKYKLKFDSRMRGTIKVDPAGDSFDIPLLFRVFEHACEVVAPEGSPQWKDATQLEYLVTSIKEFRNAVFHPHGSFTSQEVLLKVGELRELLQKTIAAASLRYNASPSDRKLMNERVSHNLNVVCTALFVPQTLQQYQKEILAVRLRRFVAESGKEELKNLYSTVSKINPIFFLGNRECHINVSAVFTELEVERTYEHREGKQIQYTELLTLADSAVDYVHSLFSLQRGSDDAEDTVPVILLEGIAGSGKSTIMKQYMSVWRDGKDTVTGIQEYDLLLFMECRDPNLNSLADLCKKSMAKTSYGLEKDDFLEAVKGQRLLILVDGLDELNNNTENLLKEIINSFLGFDITIICSTRPEKTQYFKQLCPDYLRICTVRILGIPEHLRKEFVKNYFEELQPPNIDVAYCVNSLILFLEKMQKNMGDHYRYPLNLVLLVYLWVFASEKVMYATTATRLYFEINSLTTEKLFERLKKRTQGCAVIKSKCHEVLRVLYEESLLALSNSELLLSDDSSGRLREACKERGLEPDEILSAWLVHKRLVLSPNSLERHSFPHKGIQDYFAALAVINALMIPDGQMQKDVAAMQFCQTAHVESAELKEEFRKFILEMQALVDKFSKRSIENVMKSITRWKRSNTFEMPMYQNVLAHILGLLPIIKPDIISTYAEELINLLAEAGTKTPEQWLALVIEVESHEVLTREISKRLKSEWKIRNEYLKSWTALIKWSSPKSLEINPEYVPQNTSDFCALIEAVSEKNCEVLLILYYHLQNKVSGSSDAFVQPLLNGRCRLLEFTGSAAEVATVERLPPEMNRLCVRLISTSAVAAFKGKLSGMKIHRSLELIICVERWIFNLKAYYSSGSASVEIEIRKSKDARYLESGTAPASASSADNKAFHEAKDLMSESAVKHLADVVKVLRPQKIMTTSSEDPHHIPCFPYIVEVLASINCSVHLRLNHHWKVLSDSTSDQFVLPLLTGSCNLVEFNGQLSQESSFKNFSKTMSECYLALQSTEDVNNAFTHMRGKRIFGLRLHLGKGVDPQLITQHAPVKVVALYLSGVSDDKIQWAVAVSIAVQGKDSGIQYCRIIFPSSNLTHGGLMEMMKQMRTEGVKIETRSYEDRTRYGLEVSSPHISKEEVSALSNAAYELMRCNFTLDEDRYLWSW